jgi:hypothetical protein
MAVAESRVAVRVGHCVEYLSWPRICDPSANHAECITPGFGADHLLAVSWGIGISVSEIDFAQSVINDLQGITN